MPFFVCNETVRTLYKRRKYICAPRRRRLSPAYSRAQEIGRRIHVVDNSIALMCRHEFYPVASITNFSTLDIHLLAFLLYCCLHLACHIMSSSTLRKSVSSCAGVL
ncbi:hypothetical protein K503DRAFT_203823 [Rhizopogon vinicolor AM-OR11-026]|uniref:Uncharacterized protein n=1 Tax=Rhizopogon vinicolor AM-OR11-026 TaxID=1314800 RepID=A0A1B7MZD0_9AGAM|nr:hypothetical protein K503DRAFT_203823 [Rhizopogon vinicolor AM-OR11-026]